MTFGKLAANVAIAAVIWLTIAAFAYTLLADEVGVHVGDKHLVISSAETLPGDIRVREIRWIGTTPDQPNPQPPDSPELAQVVRKLYSAVPQYSARAADSRIFGAVFMAVAVQRPGVNEHDKVAADLFSQARGRLSVDFNRNWEAFRLAIQGIRDKTNFASVDDVVNWYGTIGEILLGTDGQRGNIDFRTIVKVVAIIVDGVANQKSFFEILMDVLEALGI